MGNGNWQDFFRHGVIELNEDLQREFYQDLKTVLPKENDGENNIKNFYVFWWSLAENIRKENFQEALDISTDENENLDGEIIALLRFYSRDSRVPQEMMNQIMEAYSKDKLHNFGNFWRSLNKTDQADNIIQFMEERPDMSMQIWQNTDRKVRNQMKDEIENETSDNISIQLQKNIKESTEDGENRLVNLLDFAKRAELELSEKVMNELLADDAQKFVKYWKHMDNNTHSKYLIKAMLTYKEYAIQIWDTVNHDIKLDKFDEISTLNFSEFPEMDNKIKAFYVEKLKSLPLEERKLRYEQDKVKFIDALRRKNGLNSDISINEQNKDYNIENVNILLKLDSNSVLNNSNCDMIIKAIPILGEEIVARTYESNSEMMAGYANQIVDLICEEVLRSDKKMALKMLDKIEDVFSKDYLPSFYKIYKYFDTVVNKDDAIFKKIDEYIGSDYDFSPVLKNAKSDSLRNRIIFSDLMKISMDSNNKSFRDFLEILEDGNKIYIDIMKNGVKFEDLSSKEKQIFTDFTGVLQALYQESEAYSRAEREGRTLNLSEDVVKDAESLGKRYSADGKIEDLPDRVLKSYIGPYQELFSGITTVAQMREYIDRKTKESNERHKELASKKVNLQTGDLVKGIQDFNMEILKSILQDGLRAGEFLGTSNHTDNTPLDADFGMYVDSTDIEDKSLKEKIASTPAKGYGELGGVYIILKNDSSKREYTRVNENTSPDIKAEDETTATRIADKNKPKEAKKRNDVRTTGEYQDTRYEVFNSSGTSHYGVRTGIGATDIDYIVIDVPYDKRIGYELAMNGTYIPVVDMNTEELLFTPEQYDQIRAQMRGLSCYNADEFQVADTVFTPAVQAIVASIFTDGNPEHSKSLKEATEKRKAIEQSVEKAMARIGLTVEKEVTGDLTNGFVELIDTGSTGRGTNVPGSGDFDFTFKIDKNIMKNPEKFDRLREELIKELAHPSDDKESKIEYTDNGDFRYKQVKIEGLKDPVDIDITFMSKDERVKLSTDMCVRERLENLKASDPEGYKCTVANIILAKEKLKEAKIYKKYGSDGASEYGGFGGVGVENWILQNGGSFVEAMSSFLKASEKAEEEIKEEMPDGNPEELLAKEFKKMKNIYPIFDFGQNHRSGRYEHDSFINGLTESGYAEMKTRFKELTKEFGYLTKEFVPEETTLRKGFLEVAKEITEGRRMGNIEDIQEELIQIKDDRQLNKQINNQK